MKIQVLTENIQKKLPFVHHAVSSRSQLPVLLHFLLSARNGELVISATDLEIGIEVTIQANVETEGSTTVPGKLFLELISSLPSGKLSLELVQGALHVKTDHSKSILQTISAEEFPKLYEDIGEKVAEIGKDAIHADLSRVVFAASQDVGSRPALSGILFKKEDAGVLYVATDGYRLSWKKTATTGKGVEEPLIIPSRVIRELLFLKQEESSETIAMYIAKQSNQIVFKDQDTVLVGRTIEAEFPNYERIIPQTSAYKGTFQVTEMQKAVKTCAIFARETSHIIKLTLQKDKIIVSANTPSVGENTIEVATQATGEETEIAFNARYLLEVLTNISAEELTLETSGPLHPGVFRIVGDDTFLHLIMPIRVQA